MKCHIEKEWSSKRTSIWIYYGESELTFTLDLGEETDFSGNSKWVQTKWGEGPAKPTLTLGEREFEALTRAMGQHTQSSDATVEALKDARVVRDRLLTMIENQPC